MKNELQDLLDTQLSDLQWSQDKSYDVIRKVRGEVKVKKKLSLSLVIAMVLVLLTATAFAIYTLQRSPQAEAVKMARQALTEKYGLSAEAFGLFTTSASQTGEKWVVVFFSNDSNIPASLLGDYTVALEGSKLISAVWSHDDIMPALWQGGDVHAEAWGQPQIERSLRGDKEAEAVRMAAWEAQRAQEALLAADPTPQPAATQQDQYYYGGELATLTTPPSDALTNEQALAIAKQAILDEYGLSEAALENTDIVSCEYIVTQSGQGLWVCHLYFVHDGVEWGCGVGMDGQTGEILDVGSTTGGNG